MPEPPFLPPVSPQQREQIAMYRLTHRGHPGDVSWYRQRCRGGERVLELGCGWGRLMLPLLRDGLHVTGLDLHPGMLEAAQQSISLEPSSNQARAHLCHGDMAAFSFEERFSHILIPYNGLLTLLSEQAQHDCLRSVAAHLSPGGTLALDVYLMEDAPDEGLPDDDEEEPDEVGAWEEALPPEEHRVELLEDPESQSEHPTSQELSESDEALPDVVTRAFVGWGEEQALSYYSYEQIAQCADGERQITIAEARRWQPSLQRMDAVYFYEILQDGELSLFQDPIPQRYLLSSQLFTMLEACDLEVVSCASDFSGTPWSPGDEMLIVQAVSRSTSHP